MVLAATALNYFGVSPTAKVSAAFVGVFIVVLLSYVALAFGDVDFGNLTPVAGTGVGGVLQGAGLVFFSFAGFERVAVVASTVRKPARTIPLAIYTAFPISFVVFMLVAGVTLGVLGPSALAGNEKAPYDAFVEAIGQRWAPVLSVGVVLGTMSALASSILGISQLIREMAAEGELPAPLAQLRRERETPRNAVVVVGLAVAAIAWSVDLRPLIDVASAFALIWYGTVNFSATRLDGEQRFAPRCISWFGLLGCAALLFTLAWWAIALAVAVVTLSLALRQVVQQNRRVEDRPRPAE